MKFEWSASIKREYEKFRQSIKEYEKDSVNYPSPDDYFGSVRAGNLCFDLVTRAEDDGTIILTYDLYVGGVDSGYGYSQSLYPYDYADGGRFRIDVAKTEYFAFAKAAEKEFEEFIMKQNEKYNQADLMAKANEPLNLWNEKKEGK